VGTKKLKGEKMITYESNLTPEQIEKLKKLSENKKSYRRFFFENKIKAESGNKTDPVKSEFNEEAAKANNQLREINLYFGKGAKK